MQSIAVAVAISDLEKLRERGSRRRGCEADVLALCRMCREWRKCRTKQYIVACAGVQYKAVEPVH